MQLSVVIEWENAVFADCERSRAMLDELHKQAGELRKAGDPNSEDSRERFLGQITEKVEVIVMHDRELIDEKVVDDLVWSMAPREHEDVDLRIEPITGKRYYRLKNEGAKIAKGDLLVLIDSDVIPRDGWLIKLVGDLADESVDVVGGAVFVETESFYEKASALFWVFPLKPKHDTMDLTWHLFANNLAFRKQVFLENPFPADSNESRGACTRLFGTMRAQGKGVYRDHSARITHPAPPSDMLLRRALAEGRDAFVQDQGSKLARTLRSIVRTFRQTARGTYRTLFHGHDIKLPVWQYPGVIGLTVVYFTVFGIGGLLTPVAPKLVDRYAAL